MSKTFADIEYENRKRKTRRDTFLESMDKAVPWANLVALIHPYYYNSRRGRPPCGVEVMLRMYFLQVWFNLSDEGLEDAIYDSYAFRKFMGIDFDEKTVPDATTLLKFRHLVEKEGLAKRIFDKVNEVLEKQGHIMRGGTIVDATIIDAPSSTKNEKGERDTEMHSVKKAGQWHFGMKAHIGVDAGTGLIHTVVATAANVHDVTQTSKLIRADDHVIYGDSGYIGIERRGDIVNNLNLQGKEYRICKKPGKLKGVKRNGVRWADRDEERRKSSVRRKVEFAFHFVKNTFGYKKTVYKGLHKNLSRLYAIFASSNLLMTIRAARLQTLLRR